MGSMGLSIPKKSRNVWTSQSRNSPLGLLCLGPVEGSCSDRPAVGGIQGQGAKRAARSCQGISRTDSPQVVDRFMEMLQDSNPDVRPFAVRFLVWRNIPKAAPAIKRLLETEKDEGVRRAAGGSLW